MLVRADLVEVKRKHLKVAVTTPYLEGMDWLISDGLYESHAEIIKDALRRLFNHYELSCISDCCAVVEDGGV
jgi:hypothetical protein